MLATIVPGFVIGMGFESPILPAPWMVLEFVKDFPEPNMHVVDAMVSLPEPVSVDGWFKITQLFPLNEIVPVLFIVPCKKRSKLWTVSFPALVGMFTVPSRTPF